MSFEPAYISLHSSGELAVRLDALFNMLEQCRLCPRRCMVNRQQGEVGYCRAGARPTVSSVFPHFGEEPPLVGYRGSGTIFLAHCNLRCIFCQNYDTSHLGKGEEVSIEEFAGFMLHLQRQGCHNINFVTPTHYVSQILAALPLAIERGLRLPLVYNCGGYESLEVVKALEGVVDIYMPDAKFMAPEAASAMCNAPDYPEVVREVLREMHRQVGPLEINPKGVAERGLLVRHLVMPNDLAGSEALMRFLSEEFSEDTYVNVMDQYRPCFRASENPGINRRITAAEYELAVRAARAAGLRRGFA